MKKRIEKKVTYMKDGKKIRRSVYGHSIDEVNEKISKILSTPENADYISFQSVSEEWEEQHFANIAYGTQICYAPALRRARDAFDEMSIDEITPLDVKRILEKLAMQKYSAKTVKMQKVVIGLIFKYAVVNGYTDTNPAEYVQLPKHLSAEERTPPSQDTISIIKNSLSAPFGLFPFFLLYTGCRRGEALGIRWSDIDFKNDVIYIRQNLTYQSNRPVIQNHLKTKSGTRDVPLLSPLRDALNDVRGKKFEYVFCNNDGTLLSETQFNHRMRAYKKLTGAEFTPHQLRHEYATILYEAGVDEGTAQKIMGHADIRTTQNIYTHIRQSKIKDAATLIEKHLY